MARPGEEAERRRQLALSLSGPVGPTTIPEVTPPPLERGDVAGAERQLIEAARERFARTESPADAQRLARQKAAEVRKLPEAIPETPTLMQQAALSFLPRVVRSDGRPLSASERVEAGKRALPVVAGELATASLAPDADDGIRVEGFLEGLLGGDRVPELEQGLAAENQTLWMIRVLGSTLSSVAQESLLRIPVADTVGAARDLGAYFEHGDAARALGEAASELWGPDKSSLGEALLGVDPSQRGQRIRRENPIADWMQGILEGVERGEGFEEDLAAAAKERLGEEWENTGWWVGLGVDVLTNWERGLTSLPRAGAHLAQRLSAIGDLAPAAVKSSVNPLVEALKHNEVTGGEWLGARVGEAFEDGSVGLEDLPDEVRFFAEQVSLQEHGLTFRELLQQNGVVVPDAPTSTVLAGPRAALAKLEASELTPEGAPAASRVTEDGGVTAGGPPVEGSTLAPPPRKPRRRQKLGPRPDIAARPELPAGLKVSSVDEFFDAAGDGTFSLPRHVGFERMRHLDEGQNVDSALYQLRNAEDDLIRTGTLDELSQLMVQRNLRGDDVWYKTQRPVFGWRQTTRGGEGELPLVPNRFFSSPPEWEAVQGLAQKLVDEGRVAPPRKRGKGKVAGEAIAGTKADVLTDAPFSQVSGTRNLRLPGAIVKDATRLAFTNRVGTDLLELSPSGALLPKRENRRLRKVAGSFLSSNKLSSDDVVQVFRGEAKLSAQQEAVVQDVALRLGLDLGPREVGSLSPVQHRQITSAIVKRQAGVLGNERYRVRGLPRFSERLQEAVADGWSKRAKLGRAGAAVRATFGRVLGPVVDSPLRGLDNAAKTALRKALASLSSNSDDLAREIRQLDVRSDPKLALTTLLGRYTPMLPREVDLAASIRKADLTPEATVWVMRDEVLNVLERSPSEASRKYASWLQSDDIDVVRNALVVYEKRTLAAGHRNAMEWLQSVSEVALKRGRSTDVGEALLRVPGEMLEAVHREVVELGELNGPATRAAFAEARVELPEDYDGLQAMLGWTLRTRANAKLEEALADLLDAGVVHRQLGADDPRLSVLTSTLQGTHRTLQRLPDGTTRWEYHQTETLQVWANEQLMKWGLQPGSKVGLDTGLQLGGATVTAPEHLASEIRRLKRLGLVDSRAVFDVRVLDETLRYWKEWTTHGVGMPNIAHFMGQALSVLPTLVTTRGAAAAATAGLTFLRHPLTTAALVKRIGGATHPLFRSRLPAENLFVTAAGPVYTIDEIEAAARAQALGDTSQKIEGAAQLVDVFSTEAADGLDWRRIVRPAVWWQDMLREGAGAFDQMGRVSVMLDELDRGATLDAAARAGKEALFDFRDLNPAESKMMRKVFAFYVYMRKNADAHMLALLRDPARVTSQLRLAHAQVANQGLSDIETGSLSDEDVTRLILYSTDEVVSERGRVHPWYKLNNFSSTPLGAAEFLQMSRMFTDIPLEGDAGELLEGLNPYWQSLGVLALGEKLGSGYKFDSFTANRIPPVLLEGPHASLFMSAFNVGPAPLREGLDDPAMANQDATDAYRGQPAVWAAGRAPGLTEAQKEASFRSWQAWKTWVSRPMQTAGALGRASGLLEPRPNMTHLQEVLAFLSGIDARPVKSQDRVIREASRKKAGELERASRDIE